MAKLKKTGAAIFPQDKTTGVSESDVAEYQESRGRSKTVAPKTQDSGLVLPAQPAAPAQNVVTPQPSDPVKADPNKMSRDASDIYFRNHLRDARSDAYQAQQAARYAETDEQKQEYGKKAIAAEEKANQLESRISANRDAMESDAQRYAEKQRMESYMAYAGADDFVPKSEYRSTKNGKPVSYTAFGQISETGYGDVLYDAINGDQEARRIQSAKDALSGGNTMYTTTHEGWYNLPKEAVSLFNYIYAKQGKDAAYQFIGDYADRGMTAPEAFGYGLMSGSGAASAAAAIGSAAAKISGNEKIERNNEAWYQEYQKNLTSATAAYPTAVSIGSTIGDITLMAGASAAAGAITGGAGEVITKAVGRFAKTQAGLNAARLIGNTAAGAIHGAAMMAGMSAIRNAGEAAMGNMSGGDYAKDIIYAGAKGTAMSLTSAILSAGGGKIIRSAGIDNAFSRYLKNLVSGGIGMSVPAVIDYASNYDKDREKFIESYVAMTGGDAETAGSMYDRAKRQQLGKQILSGFLFTALSSVGSTAREIEAGREKLEEVYDHLLQVYLKAANYTAASPEAQTEYLNDLRGILTQYIRIVEKSEFAGQQKYVNKLLDELYSLTAIEVGGNFVNTEPTMDNGLLMLVSAAVEPSVEQEVSAAPIALSPAPQNAPEVTEQATVVPSETPAEAPVEAAQPAVPVVESTERTVMPEPEEKPITLPPVPEQKAEEIVEQTSEALPEAPVLTEMPKDDTLLPESDGIEKAPDEYVDRLTQVFTEAPEEVETLREMGLISEEDIAEKSADALWRALEEAQNIRKAQKYEEPIAEYRNNFPSGIESQKAVKAYAKEIVTEYSSKTKPVSVAAGISNAMTMLSGESVSSRDFRNSIENTAKEILENASETVYTDEAISEIRKFLKSTKISFDGKGEITDYNDFRKRNIGKFVISKNGTPIDVLWGELQETFGKGYFPEDIINPTDMIEHIADLLDGGRAISINPHRENMAEAMDELVDKIANKILSGELLEKGGEELAAGKETADGKETVRPDTGEASKTGKTSGRIQREEGSTAEEETLTLPKSEKIEEKPEEKPVELPTENTPQRKPHEVLSDALLKKLNSGEGITREELQSLAADAYGGSRSTGSFDMKTAYDVLELAVNRYLMNADFVKNGNGNEASARMVEKRMQQLLDRLPTQNIRTEEQVQYQQFSTPPNIAYLAAWLANIAETDSILEPSAGIGGLALWGKAWGATVYANELSQRRAEILRSLGLDEVFTENAEQIDNILPDRVKPTVVLMNPPFSSAAGRTTTNNTANAKRHVEQALSRLQDGGRLVAILGRGMANDSKTFAKWWDELRNEYNIRANLSINGDNYKKYGTTFDVQLVVIDKTGAQEDRSSTITGQVDDLLTVPEMLSEVRNDRQRTEVADMLDLRDGDKLRIPSGPSELEGSGSSGRSGSRSDGGIVGEAGRSVEPSGRGGRGLQPRRAGGDAASTGQRSGGGLRGEGNGVPERDSGERSPERNDKPVSVLTSEPEETRPSAPKSDDGVYAEYVPPKTGIRGAKKHPAKLVESAAMASVPSPAVNYKPNLPEELISSGALSDVQLTNIVYAGAAHSQMIPEQNVRKGYFIGDGTGVGKGRQIAGIIMDNMRQGRRKAVWISKNSNLYADAQRDWSDLGGDKQKVYSLGKVKVGDAIKPDDGIIFTTYDTLASKSQKTKQSRIDQLVNWLGADFDGVIAFDEAHNLGNLLGKKGTFGKASPSQKAIAGAEFQKRLPNARVVYVSATMATEVEGMAFADRLGLWGPGTQFKNVNDFVEKIGSGGLAAMELVARDMKAMGLYQARSISFDGVNYDTLTHQLTDVQTEIYDTMSRAWQITLQNIEAAMKSTNMDKNSRAKSAAKSAYYGAMQRFYNQVLTSMVMPSVVKDIQRQLDAGKSVVLQIVNTNEAATERGITAMEDDGGSPEDLDITPREALIGYLQNSFPVQEYEVFEDENGNKRSRPVVDSAGNPVLNRKAVADRDRLIAQIEQMSVPQGALDLLLDAFGAENVAEVTGRKRRVVKARGDDGNMTTIIEKRGKNSNDADVQAFQDGKKRILVFSDAGGTGKSYHADLRAKNQQQRVHYLLQPGWNAPNAVQGLGRTNRSNQANAPTYVLVTTNASGQKRFVSTIARRLDQLGAITKGQRQTGSGVFSAKDNLESDLARDALVNFYKSLIAGKLEGLDPNEILESLGLAKSIMGKDGKSGLNMQIASNTSTFLNRILSLEIEKQNAVFDAYNEILESMYQKAEEDGTLDKGMETVRADKVEVADEITVYTDPATGAETKYVQARAYTKTNPAKTLKELQGRAKDFIGLYRKKDGAVIGVFKAANSTDSAGRVVQNVKVLGPVSRGVWQTKTLEKQAEPIAKGEWETAWAEEVDRAPKFREETKHMLTGTLLPVWNKLPTSGNVRVQRLIADDGRQYLGRIIDPSMIDGVLRSLGVTKGRTKKTYTPEEVLRSVLDDGGKAILTDDRMTLTRRLVGGEQRIEITGDNLWSIQRRIPEIYTENIQSKWRYFIPNGEKQLDILKKLLTMNPVSEVNGSAGRSTSYSKDVKALNGNQLQNRPDMWKTDRVGDREAKAMSLTDLVEKLRHEYNIPVNTGGLRAPDARAAYFTQPRSVRLKVTDDISDLSHELGHHLDNIYGIEDKIEKAAMEEAVSKLPEEFKAAYEPDELNGEAISEFVRRYLLNSATAKIDYPTFYDEFFKAVGSSETKTLAELADEFNAYYSLSAEQENYPIHNREDRGRDFRTFREKSADINERFRMAILDTTASLEHLDKETGGDSHMFAINSAYISNRISAALSTNGLYDMRGNKIGESLGTILKGVNLNNKAEYNALGMWLVCKHGIEVLADGHRVFANDAMNNEGYMLDEMERIEAKYPKIDFEDIAERLYAFQDAVLQAYGVDGQLYTPEMVQAWRDKWKYYVPFYRWFGGKEGKSLKATKKGFANQTGHVRRLIGSGREFINPVDNIMESTARFMTEAILNDVMLHVADDVNGTEGLGWLMEKFPAKMKRTTMDITDRKDSFLSGLIEQGLVDTDTYDQIADLLNNELDDILEQYSRGKEGGDTITVMRRGEPEVWKINDASLLKSITNMNAGMRSQVMGAIASATRFVSANITGRNIVWSVTSNSVRDLFTLLILGDFNHAGKLISGIVSGWANSFKGDNADDLFKEYIAMGGGSTSSFTADKQMAKVIRKEVQPDKWHYLNPITYMSFLGDMIERGPRFATYRLYRLEKGATPEQAFYAAMESTVNFRRSGMYTKEFGAMIPFFGASVQSVDRAARWLQADEIKDPKQKKRVSRGRISAWLGVSFAIAALTTLLNNSTEKKRKYYGYLSNYTKNSYFVIQQKDGKVLAIPKARELMIPISFFERVIERTVLGNKNAFDGFWEYVTDNTLPGVISGVAQGDLNSAVGDLSIIGGIHYLQSNQDFLGRPIVSAGLANLNKEDQWNGTTSVPARYLGQALNLSPQQLDFIGTNYFSFAWKPVKAVWNVGGNPDYTLGVKSQWIKDSLFSTDVVNALYDARDKAEADKNSNPGDTEKAVRWKLLDSTATAYSAYYKLAKTEPETEESRAIRESVLDSIIGAVGGESADPAFRYVKDAANADTPGNIMPSVMKPEFEYEDGNSGKKLKISLNAAEFWDFQTDYNAKYYNYLRSAMKSSDSAEEKASVCKAAKDIALIMARGKVIEAHGGSYSAYDDLLDFVDGGGNPADFIRYRAAKDIVDDNGYNSSDAARVVAGLQLPDVYTQSFLLSQQSESLGNRFKAASGFGVDIDDFSLVMDAFADTQNAWKSSGRSGESGWTQKAAEEAIDMIYGKTTIQNRSEKAAAWQALNSQWSPKSNPYSQDVGRTIVDTIETLKLPTE